MQSRLLRRIGSTFIATVAMAAAALAQSASAQTIENVVFPGLAPDGYSLLAYLFKPNPDAFPGPRPAVVVMHGRAGPYSSAQHGLGCDGQFTPNACYNVTTLSIKIESWGKRWQELGYVALVVDGFGSRGRPEGFAAGTFSDRAEMFDPKIARVADSYAALNYLRTRGDVIADRIGIHGGSNGGTTALNVVGVVNGFLASPTTTTGFRAAISFYPGCGTTSMRMPNYVNYAPTIMFLAQDDDEVDPANCIAVAGTATAQGGNLSYTLYPDTNHSFDDPSASVQSPKRNRPSSTEARRRAEQFFATHVMN
jgi:dienelactone hydrolase